MNSDKEQAIGDRMTADRALTQLMERERSLCKVDENGRAIRTADGTLVRAQSMRGYVWALRS